MATENRLAGRRVQEREPRRGHPKRQGEAVYVGPSGPGSKADTSIVVGVAWNSTDDDGARALQEIAFGKLDLLPDEPAPPAPAPTT